MSDTAKTMTPGQMRQIISLATASVPADLSYEEAMHILRASKPLRDKLESVWNATRVPDQTFSVKLPEGDLCELPERSCFQFRRPFELNKTLDYFTFSGKRGRRVNLTVRVYERGYPADTMRRLERDGYRSADLREFFGFCTQYVDTAADGSHLIVPSGTVDANTRYLGCWNYDNPLFDHTAPDSALFYSERGDMDGSWDWKVLAVKL